MRPRVSLVIITSNEEKNIARCIDSVDWADDVLVLDSGSTDRTCEIARQRGARVFQEKFRGFRAQKERATELALHNWIVSLDADEAFSNELSEEIKDLLSQKANFDGVETPRLSFHLGRWIRHGGWYPDYQVRVFDRTRAKWIGGHVHERVIATGTVRTRNAIQHWVFENLEDQVETNNFYSSKGALDLRDKGKSFSIFRLVTKPISKFFETYLLKRGFLDGMPGFIISVGAAYSIFLKYAKLWEIQRLGRGKV